MSTPGAPAVVCAYHNVGVRGLAVLLALGVDVRLVLTHEDEAAETIWFRSVAELARLHGIPVITPADPNAPEVVAQVRACALDWLFSFYYRRLLGAELLALPARGAYNVHGSLLPKYRGRAPVNWAVLHGERETGASLHRMELKPDAGALVDQEAVAILPNDTAHDVFGKVACAAEILLLRAVPALLGGTARETPLDLKAGRYFGGRRPEDGRLDPGSGAWPTHNLIRAVAPPYPGAFYELPAGRLAVLGSYYRGEPARGRTPRLYWEQGACWLDCSDGERLRLTALAWDGAPLDESGFRARFGAAELSLT
ncbi:MAG TPA: formyltransferase [bacterium]|nr:formyltransferase [bacterium]